MAKHHLTADWNKYLRKEALLERSRTSKCPYCNGRVPLNLEKFRAHVQAESSTHGGLDDDSAIQEAFRNMTLKSPYAFGLSLSLSPSLSLCLSLPLTPSLLASSLSP